MKHYVQGKRAPGSTETEIVRAALLTLDEAVELAKSAIASGWREVEICQVVAADKAKEGRR